MEREEQQLEGSIPHASSSLSTSTPSSESSSEDSKSLLGSSSGGESDEGKSKFLHSRRDNCKRRYAKFKRTTQGRAGGFKRKKKDLTVNTGNRRQNRTYYESDNSYEPGRIERKIKDSRQTMDYTKHADGRWGRMPLTANLLEEDLADLIGLTVTEGDHAFEHSIGEAGEHYLEQNFDQEREAFNPSYGEDKTPPSPEFLQYILERIQNHQEYDESLNEAFDTSAIVAIGMFIEEMLTTAMLPIAGLHVLRCRELENKPGEDGGHYEPLGEKVAHHPVTGEKVIYDTRRIDLTVGAFNTWTMPAEKAMYKVLEEGFDAENGISMAPYPRVVVARHEMGNPSLKAIENEKLKPGVFSFFPGDFWKANKALLPLFECHIGPATSTCTVAWSHSPTPKSIPSSSELAIVHQSKPNDGDATETSAAFTEGNGEQSLGDDTEGVGQEGSTGLIILNTQDSSSESIHSDGSYGDSDVGDSPSIPLGQLSASQQSGD